MQAAKLDAALSSASRQSSATPTGDARSHSQLVAALARSVRLSQALHREFELGVDFSGPGWAAILALSGAPEIAGQAVVRLVLVPSRGSGASVPASYYAVELEVCATVDRSQNTYIHPVRVSSSCLHWTAQVLICCVLLESTELIIFLE